MLRRFHGDGQLGIQLELPPQCTDGSSSLTAIPPVSTSVWPAPTSPSKPESKRRQEQAQYASYRHQALQADLAKLLKWLDEWSASTGIAVEDPYLLTKEDHYSSGDLLIIDSQPTVADWFCGLSGIQPRSLITPTRRQLRRRRNKGQLLRLPGQRDSVVLEERSIHVG